MTFLRSSPRCIPHVRANLMQHSVASAPVVSKNTRHSGSGNHDANSLTNSARASVAKQ
jgi:hypothetical protein